MGGGNKASEAAVKHGILIAVLASGCAATSGVRPVSAAPQVESPPIGWASRPVDAAAADEGVTSALRAGAEPFEEDEAEEEADDAAEIETAIASDAGTGGAGAEVQLVAGTASKKAVAKAGLKKKQKKKVTRGRRIAASASRLVGLKTLTRVTRQVPDDCTGVPRYVFRKYGIDLMDVEGRPGENGVTLIHRRALKAGALHKRVPRPGDLVFFRETYDRNRDGRRNDGLTHVGIVEKVEKDGTVVFVHRGSKGVSRARMNLKTPKARAADGKVLNDFLRPSTASSRAYLTGELFSSFASPERL